MNIEPRAEAESVAPEAVVAGVDERWPHDCDVHAGVPAWAACARCGRFVCRQCRQQGPDNAESLCVACLQTHMRDAIVAEHVALAVAAGHDITADDVNVQTIEVGELESRRLSDYPSTIRKVLFGPGRFFTQMNPDGQLLHAIVFGILFGSLGLFLNLAWSSNTPEFEASIVEMMETYSVSRNAIFVVLVFIV